MLGASNILLLLYKESTLSNVFSSIRHLPLPGCAVRRNPWHVKCGLDESAAAATSSVLLNNTMCDGSKSAGRLRESHGDTGSLWHAPLINQSEVRSNAPLPQQGGGGGWTGPTAGTSER